MFDTLPRHALDLIAKYHGFEDVALKIKLLEIKDKRRLAQRTPNESQDRSVADSRKGWRKRLRAS